MRWFLKFIFGIKLYMFRTVTVHHQEFITVHTAMVYVVQVCRQLASSISKPLWHIPLLCVQWNTPDDARRNYSKHVEFYSKNKFEKLMQLVGFIIRIYHVAQSLERHILQDIIRELVFLIQSAAERTPLFEKRINSKPKKIWQIFFYFWKAHRMPFYINALWITHHISGGLEYW